MKKNNKNNKGLVCHVHGDLVLVKILYCLSHKYDSIIQSMENIVLKHNTRVVLCFSKNTQSKCVT